MSYRKSSFIRRQQATYSRPAILLAEKKKVPLNFLVTLNFTDTEIDEMDASGAFSEIRARFKRWAKKPPKKDKIESFETAFIWVLENTGATAAHWLVHIPDGRLSAFQRRLLIWLKKEAGEIQSSSAVDVRPAYNPHGARKYMLKGIDPSYSALYRIEHKPQGLVYGKRFGFSQNIGPKECEEHKTKRPWRGNYREYNPILQVPTGP